MNYTTQTITRDNFTVTIHKPILNERERKKREQEIIVALARFGKEMEKQDNEQTVF